MSDDHLWDGSGARTRTQRLEALLDRPRDVAGWRAGARLPQPPIRWRTRFAISGPRWRPRRPCSS